MERREEYSMEDLQRFLHEDTEVKEMKQTEGWKRIEAVMRNIYDTAIYMVSSEESNDAQRREYGATIRTINRIFQIIDNVDEHIQAIGKEIDAKQQAAVKTKYRPGRDNLKEGAK